MLFFFKSDRAACFANKILRSESKGKGHYFQDWEAFEKAFLDQFCPKNEQLTALTKLEGTSWYQGKDPVDDYIDQFQELIDLMEYDDDKTIVIKFRCGLDLALQNQVALLGDGTPDFGDLEEWYEAARRVFQNKEANKAFIETNRGVTRNHVPTPPAAKFGGVFVPTRKVFPTALMQNLIPRPSENSPAPMDIDHAHQRGNHTTVCL